MDFIWTNLCTNPSTHANLFLQVLTIPHSNAAEERVCLMINENETQFHSTLYLGKSLNSIIHIKMNNPEGLVLCQMIKFCEELLWKCNSAYMHYNKERSSVSWFTQMSFVFSFWFLTLCICKSLKRNIVYLTIMHFS